MKYLDIKELRWHPHFRTSTFSYLLWLYEYGGDWSSVADGIILYIVKNRDKFSTEEMEDVVSETLERLVRYKDNYQGRCSLSTYTYTIMRNTMIKHFTHKDVIRRGIPLVDIEVDIPVPSEEMRIETVQQINQAIRSVPKSIRGAIVCDMIGLENAEGADRMGIPLGTYKTRLLRSRNYIYNHTKGGLDYDIAKIVVEEALSQMG